MAKKRKNLNATTKVNPPAHIAAPKKREDSIPFHLSFPFELHHIDGVDKKTCWFKDEIDLEKYIQRYKLKKKEFTIKQTEPRK